MTVPLIRRATVLAGTAAVLLSGAALAQGVQLTMFGRIEPGLWDLRMRDGGAIQRICIGDARRLIQLRHPQASCRQFVVQDDSDEATVHYSCPGQGYGRTHLRLESTRLVQVESQGIADKLPFEFAAEARRVGSCG